MSLTLDNLIIGANKAHLAVENKDIDFLKKCDKDMLLIQDRDGETPLHYAAINDDLKICKLLIELNSNIVNIKDIENKTAYDWCLEYFDEYGSHSNIIGFLRTFNV